MNNSEHRRHVFVALLFTTLLFVFEAVYFPFKHNEADLPAQLLGWFLTFGSFTLVFYFTRSALSAPYLYRLAYFAVFTLAVFTEYGYYTAVQHFSTTEDLENILFGTNLDNKIDAVMIYFNRTALLPSLAFLILLLTVKPILRSGWRNSAAVLLTAIAFFLATGYFTTNSFPIISVGAYYRTLIGSPFKLDYLNFTPRRPVEYRAAAPTPNNIVFIVDESIAGSHLGLNGYARPTTPFLDELHEKSSIANWGLAISGTTCSITANKLLLTGITDLPDEKKQLLNNPVIFQYAKAMGYKTFYFDGQMNNLWSLSDFDRQFIDEHITKEKLPVADEYDIDAEIARQTNRIINGSTGNFIWINKRGTHFPYHKAYPKSAEKWSPVFYTDPPLPVFPDREEEKQAFVNSYDNAVRYNLQLFFSTLFGAGINRNTFYLYTSDHGQNLKDIPEQGTHCADAPPQAVVPLLLIADPEKLPAVDTDYRASHSNIFATLLDLMEFPQSERKFRYDLSLLKATAADSKPRHYFVGNLSGSGDGRRIAFEEPQPISRK